MENLSVNEKQRFMNYDEAPGVSSPLVLQPMVIYYDNNGT